jgi:hypothetical protein
VAAREFTDSWGTTWRVWDVTPDVMHPVTRTEEFMAKLQDGWLTFESDTEKRRLPAPYPSDWPSFNLKQLEALCQRAAPVIRKSNTPTGEERATIVHEIERAAIDQTGEVRTFVSPRGRSWTVRVHECLDRKGEHTTVLRFTSGDLIVELSDWPASWRTASVTDYALMLLDAEPPRRLRTGSTPQRRWDDRRV